MKFMDIFFSFVCLFLFCEKTSCLKILTVMPIHLKSHWFIGFSIAKTLVEAGHEVTFVSQFELQNSSKLYRDIKLDGAEKIISRKGWRNISRPKLMYNQRVTGSKLSEHVFRDPHVIKIMNDKNEKFDLVIVELFGTLNFIGFGEYFNAPVIGCVPFGSTKWTQDVSGNTAPLSYVPTFFADSTSRMSFKQRLDNALLVTVERFIDLIFYQSEKKVYEKHFPNATLSYTEMINKGVSLVLLNTHFSFHPLAPYLPNTIDIGGFHVERNINPLPKDLKIFIESAEFGVIYFSLGSIVQSSDISFKTQNALMKAFSKLKQKVIWKTEKVDTETLSDNVLIRNWCPQNDILAHPNVKLFITHGGILSLIEAVYHSKPIIGIPLFGDQKVNVAFAEEKGFGYRLNLNQLTVRLISKALNSVLYNQSYAENVKQISKIYHDQPMTPKEKLIYWVEYVARHKGAPHLKSPGQELNFIQYHMIDVFSLIFIVAVLGLLSSIYCIKLIFKRIFVQKIKSD